MGGFELLDLHDFPGQGTALVGVVNPFWEDKGYVTADEYRRFCNTTVPLARMNKRVFTTDEKLEADIEVAHFGPAPLAPAAVVWKLLDVDGNVVTNAGWGVKPIPVGNGISLGSLSLGLGSLRAPMRYKLVVGVGQVSRDSSARRSGQPLFENDWDVWVYPPSVNTEPPPGVVVANDLNEDTLAKLDGGGKVLLLIPPDRVKRDQAAPVALGFSSIFWNTAWTGRQAPTTLGILCDPKHPALAQFPTEFHSDWQWWYLVSRAGAMILDDLPRGLQPTVQVIDDWVTSRKLGLLFEARLGRGKLLACSIDLKKDLPQNPVARQLLHSLTTYMGGAGFKPTITLTPAQVRGLMETGSPP
jgi:hypothetical protein